MVKNIPSIDTRDPLTGAFIRVNFAERVAFEIQRGGNFSILFLDIDLFRKVNEAYGHQRGDETLIAFTSIIRRELRPQDILVRYGGEEFYVLLPETGLEEAQSLAIQLEEGVANSSFQAGTDTFHITVTIGVACSQGKGDTKDELLQRVEKDLYEKKCKKYHIA
jgi:two-component system, cell cycle response regulator